MNKTKAVCLAALLGVAATGPAFATDPLESAGITPSANVGFVSEYSFRGLAQSDERPAVQGGFDLSHTSGFYAGVWGSNVDFNDGDEATVEVDVYGGYAGEFNKVTYDLGVLYYMYPGADSDLDYDFWEFAVSLGYDFEVVALSASYNYSPNNFADSGDAHYFSAAFEAPVFKGLTVNGHFGHQEIDDEDAFGVDDYNDWSLGLGYNLYGFDLALQYVDTNLDETDECADGCEERVIFGVSRSF